MNINEHKEKQGQTKDNQRNTNRNKENRDKHRNTQRSKEKHKTQNKKGKPGGTKTNKLRTTTKNNSHSENK